MWFEILKLKLENQSSVCNFSIFESKKKTRKPFQSNIKSIKPEAEVHNGSLSLHPMCTGLELAGMG